MASFEDIEQENINYATENYDRDIAMSQRFAQAQKSVDWNEHPFLDLQDANKASRNPIERVFDESDLKNLKSDTGDIAWNSFRKGVLDLQSFGDKAEMALGNTLAGISGNTLGTEMRDRAADSLMKTMEESRFIDSNYGDAETWTARFVGGGMSMGEMLAVGAATGGIGLGAYVGTLSLSDGALNDMAKYQEEHGSLDGYKTDPVNLALDYANAVFQVATEEVGGAGRFLNGKVLKAGKTGSAIAKETLINFLQESAQGAASDLTEVLKGNQNADVLLENATGYLKDGVVAGVLGGVLGGATYKLNKHRAIQNLNEINKVLHPDKTEQEINKISEEVFAKTEEKMEKSFVPELVAQTEAVNDKGKIRDNVRNKVAAMYEDADMSEKQKAKTIEATTTLELENMLYDSIERKIPLTSHPLLQGEVNELGWFREGIPEHRRAEIESLRQEYVSMRDELKAENESADKNYQKIEELETKIELFKKDIAKKLADMAVADKQMIQDMIDEQRKIVRESQARKQMLAETKRKAEKAAQKQDKEEAILAGKMATGAEKARAKREKAETAQQTKEAKIRSLQEQRDIARTIKAVKVSLAQQKQTPAQMQKQATEPQVMFQDQFDLADENARLDDIYPEYTGETIRIIDPAELKQAQYEVIQRTNPMQDEYHVGIRSVNDIKTFDETIDDKDSFVWGDYSQEDAKRDLAKNEITIYSSKPIENGVFVSTSYRQAQEYAGGKGAKVYKKTVPLDYVAWISGDEGQFAITDVVGKKRSVYNSNGDRIAKSKEALTNFWRWFGDSKVVDEQGRPLVVYHGSENLFDTFEKTDVANAYFFAGDKKVAERFRTAEQRKAESKYYAENTVVEPVSEEKYDSQGRYLGSVHYTKTTLPSYKNFGLYSVYLKADDIQVMSGEQVGAGEFRDSMIESARQSGKDGVIIYQADTGKGETTEYIVFNSNQIKSVDNRGTYSSDTGNIYLQETTSTRYRAIDPRFVIPKVRGGWTKDKILRYLKDYSSHAGAGIAAREIANFDTFEDFMNHVFYHGARYGTSGRMQPSITMSDREVERIGGGGYGEKYWAISVTKSKKVAGNFATSMGGGNIYPILLAKNAKVIEMPELTDSVDLEDHIVDLYEKGIDAVWIGDKNAGEQELAVINPRALINIGSSEYYGAYKLGSEENPIRLNTEEDFRKIYEFAKNYKNMDENTRLDEAKRIVHWQNRVSGAAPSTYRGAYVPEYRFIQATENMDASTLNHELAHDWGQEYFRWARSGKASESFLRSWGAVEKAIGITDKDTYFTYDASEKFARAYEGWLLQRKDWADILKIDTPDERKAVEEMMEDYRQELVDIYDSLLESSKYFKMTYGEVGELKPELVEFFERATRYDDIELRQKRGEITEEQANQEKLNHLVETAVNGQAEQEPAGAPEMMEDLRKAENDTERFEAEGGNKKALQTRLDRIALAKDLTANEEAMGRYDSHRDMLAVAEQADEFVKNRRDDALAIINGEMAEQDGLYASDLYTALERVANATGDFDLIDELRHSKIANEMAKELGQRVAGFRNYKGSGDVDVMSTLKSVEKQLNKGYTDDMKALAREDVESLIAELKIADNTAELDKFFDEMECK